LGYGSGISTRKKGQKSDTNLLTENCCLGEQSREPEQLESEGELTLPETRCAFCVRSHLPEGC